MKIGLLVCALFISLGTFASTNYRTLNAAEVKQAFTDKTILGVNYRKGKTVRIYASPTGEWIANPGGKKYIHFNWSVSSNGEHCKTGMGDNGCGEIISKGETGVYYKIVNGQERFKFTIVGDGNQL